MQLSQLPHVLGHDRLAEDDAIQDGVGCHLTIADPLRLHAVGDLAAGVVSHFDPLITVIQIQRGVFSASL